MAEKKNLPKINEFGCTCQASVLIVDDNPFNLIPLSVNLKEKHKLFSDLGEDGIEEVKMFKKNMEKTCCDFRYRLVLTDLNMPNLDGIQAAVQIFAYQEERRKNDPTYKFVPIVAVTAYEDQETLSKCIEVGMATVL